MWFCNEVTIFSYCIYGTVLENYDFTFSLLILPLVDSQMVVFNRKTKMKGDICYALDATGIEKYDFC